MQQQTKRKMKPITTNQAIKLAKKAYKEKYGVNPYNALITEMPTWTSFYILIMKGDKTIEYHFNKK